MRNDLHFNVNAKVNCIEKCKVKVIQTCSSFSYCRLTEKCLMKITATTSRTRAKTLCTHSVGELKWKIESKPAEPASLVRWCTISYMCYRNIDNENTYFELMLLIVVWPNACVSPSTMQRNWELTFRYLKKDWRNIIPIFTQFYLK